MRVAKKSGAKKLAAKGRAQARKTARSATKVSSLQNQSDERRRQIVANYARRHPGRAKAERILRIKQHQVADRWSHKRHGTPETHEHAARQQQGAMARLYKRGGIDIHQLADAQAIAAIAESIAANVTIRTVSLEPRVDGGGGLGGQFYEALGAVRGEMAYSAWRGRLPCPQPVLAMIVGDCGITEAAARYGMTARRTRKLLIEALDAWPACHAEARKRVDAGDLAAMHAGLV